MKFSECGNGFRDFGNTILEALGVFKEFVESFWSFSKKRRLGSTSEILTKDEKSKKKDPEN